MSTQVREETRKIICKFGNYPVNEGMEKDTEAAQKNRSAKFLKMRDLWIDYVNQHHDLSHATVRVGIFLALRMNSKQQFTWWSVDKLAKTLHVSTKTVSEATLSLEKHNLLIVRRSKRLGNEYRIRLPISLDT